MSCFIPTPSCVLSSVMQAVLQIMVQVNMTIAGSSQQVAALRQMDAMSLLAAGNSLSKALPAPKGRRTHGQPSCVVTDEGSRGRSASRKPARRTPLGGS
jgi:hypothetical protein